MNPSIPVFIAACSGASVALLFGWFSFPGASARKQFWLSCAYIVIAGYFAAFVLRVADVFQAFMLGIAQDALFKCLRSAAMRSSESLIQCDDNKSDGGNREE